ncbi:MAG TPA: glycoside hydrolase family 65, partial [Clostridia bacterium]
MIDRRDLVTRHNPVLQADRPADPVALAALTASPLSVGNGEFAFTADFTGLQTLRDAYRLVPLCTMSQWGWHGFPVDMEENALRLKPFDTYGRVVGYASDATGQQRLFDDLRQNPHRLHLGAVGFRFSESVWGGRTADAQDFRGASQSLDLWNGLLGSAFSVFGRSVVTETLVDPDSDTLAAHITLDASWDPEGESAAVEIAFPYGSPAKDAADWNAADRHHSDVLSGDGQRVLIRRTLDSDIYYVDLRFEGAVFRQSGPHRFELQLREREAWFSCRFTRESPAGLPGEYPDLRQRTSAHWHAFWTCGGVMRLRDSADKRAFELERRVVLSQYLTAIQCAG